MVSETNQYEISSLYEQTEENIVDASMVSHYLQKPLGLAYIIS